MVFRSDLSIITGSPGTGKTTVLKAVIEVFKLLKPSENILLAAPTGRASRRMAESTGVNNASTLHSLLGLFGEDGGFRKGEEDMLDAGLIIVDESSMMDMWLARQFFSRIGPNTKVLLVGDAVEEIPAAAFLHAASPATKLQNGAGICLAAAQAAWQTPEELFPEYLQLVKAEKDLREKQRVK